jgi:molybdopterin molybdotransferase
MPEFLNLLPPSQALDLFLKTLGPVIPTCERIPVAGGCGRVVAAAVISPEDLPAFNRSTVDGYAVHARDTFGASETLPMYLSLAGEVPMGQAPAFDLLPGQAALIHTGGMLPAGTDAVVMLEMTQAVTAVEIEILKSVAVGENILKAGEDVLTGAEVLAQGVLLGPAEIGGLLALGITEIEVARRPRVAIISSGDEVIPPGQRPAAGQVRDINSYTLGALVSRHGGEALLLGIVPDRAAALKAALQEALEGSDLVVITAGSSASTRDLTSEVIDQMGSPGVIVHGVDVKPGKPTILAVCDGKPMVGLPGNPVSALVIARLFVVPVIERLLGLGPKPQPSIHARLSLNLASQAGREDFVPVRLVSVAGGLWVAEPVFYKSNLIFSLTRADGLVHIPADANGLEAGQSVEVWPL